MCYDLLSYNQGSWKDGQLPCPPFLSRTPPMHPMEYTQLSSPDQFTRGPRSPTHHRSDWAYPTTYLTRHQPACQECGDDMTGDCEYCVLLEVDDEPPSPMRYSSSSLSSPPDCLSTRSESGQTGLQTLSHFKPSAKEEPRIQELALKDDPGKLNLNKIYSSTVLSLRLYFFLLKEEVIGSFPK